MTIDARQYLPAFLDEAREHLQELGLAILRIEASPDDRLAAEGVFRIAHSLKGMSATLGFDAIAALTHAMEDVFELLRQRSGGLPPDAIDVLSACLDALEGAVEAIAADGEERLDPAPLVARLQQLARERTPAQELARDGDVALPDLPDAARRVSAGERVLHLVADVAEDCSMPAVRAYMLFAALAGHGELLGGVPAPDAVERFSGRRIEAWIATAVDEDVLVAAAHAIGELASVGVREAPLLEPPAVIADPDATDDAGDAAPAVRRPAAATVRVDAERLDELLHLMGELIQHRTAVEALAADVAPGVHGLPQALQRLARSSQALQETVTRVRMVPVESVFLRFPRLVRDLAARLGKQVELRLGGAETELDRTVVDALGDPLVHLVRNALDHGLEEPAERVAAGKSANGVLELSARHAGGYVIVAVRDDGRGIDPAAVARTAVERGLLEEREEAAVDQARAAELLFTPGFSTARETTDLSGRGIGMDAVRESVRALGGDVTIVSSPGAGTLAQLRLPLTLASIAALLVTADGLAFALPLDRVVRTVRLADHPVRTVRGAPLLPLGDELLPLLDAGAVLGPAGPDVGAGDRHAAVRALERDFAVVVACGDRRVALAVGTLAGQRELVTRRLPRALGARAAAAGGAVLPDGSIAVVVDCDALAAPLPATEGAPR